MQKDEYISRFSHELRNPLTLIRGSLQLLEKECPAVRESDLWKQIRKDMDDVIQLLNDMSAPFGSYRITPVRFTDFFSEISASFAPSMKTRGICFVTELSDELSGTVINVDRQKLRQAVTNLLVNAADAVSGQATSGRITLYAVADRQELCVHVRDNGPGIPQEYLPDLFEPFVTHKSNGTGLGLGIARRIARQHGGSLTVDSCCALAGAHDSYTDFCLRLPLH